ncbi:MAG: phosphate acyltransferase PlsX [Acholeplasmatales bacterium]|nr:phosphate acyltransferase PlsX [Acholeplasmatales bacterium]
MIKIAIDAMGGDFGVTTTVPAAMEAVKRFKDIEIVLVGDETKINPLLTNKERITISHTTEVLDMGEHDPVKAIRSNKEASMVKAMYLGRNKEVDAVVSSGPTQCLIIGAHLIIRRIKLMQRVALCPIIPSFDGKGKLLLDVGANVELKPEHYHEFAVAGSIIAHEILGFDNPKVGLINIGSEKGKGREVDNLAYDILEQSKLINFCGNVEPNEVLTNDVRVIVSDGFTGNMVLKTTEGTAKAMAKMLKQEIKASMGGKIGYLFMRKNLKRFAKRLDSSEVGGAMIVGVESPVIKAHGNSDSHAFYNAIRQAREMVLKDVIGKLKEDLAKNSGDTSEAN